MRLSAGGLGLGLTSYQITICRFALGAGAGAFVMAPECYSHSRVPEAMNGVREQAQEARGCLCRFLVATQQAESTGPEDRTRFHRVPGVG